MTLLKAYLRGETDPIMLAKAYYEDMIHKSVEFADRLVRETLSFDMEKDMKIWEQEIKEAQDEIKFWEGLVSNLKAANIFGFKTMLQEASREDLDGDIESINLEEVPAYVKELRNHIKNVQANINDGHEEYRAVIKEISGLDTGDWDKGRKGGWSDEQEYIPKDPEIYIKIHNIGLSYIRDKIQTYKDRFEYLKGLPKRKGGIPKIKPKALKELQAKIQAKLQEFKSTPIEDRPSPKEREEILSGIEREIDKYSMDIWTWQHLETKIKTWSGREKTSVKKLEQFNFMLKYTEDKEKIKSEMNKKGYELVSSPVIEVKDGVPELINPNYQFMKLVSGEKKYFEYDVESKKLNPIEEKKVVFEETTPGRMKFSDEKWWKQLSKTSERVANSPRVASQKIFQTALKDFFEGFSGTRFDEPVTANKTKSGIGGTDEKSGKEIKENPNTRLLNLQKLYRLFEEHIQQPANRDTDINTIMAGLSAEIEYLEGVFERKRDKEGQVPNKNTGKKILKVLRESLTAMYDSIRHYKGGDYPEKFITHLNKVKKTRLTLRELQIFARNQVTIKSLVNSEDRRIKDRAKYLLDTFDEDMSDFKKVVKLLEKPIGKEDNTLIKVIADVWNEEGTYKAPTKTKEGQSSLNRLLDEALSDFEKILDEQENAVTQIADPELEEKIEQNLEWMTVMLEHLEDGIDFDTREYSEDEDEDELLQWFANSVEEFRNRVWEVMRRLNPDDADYKRIKEIKDKIIDEVKNIPKVSHLVEDLVKIRSSNPEYILTQRLNKVESMANGIFMAQQQGYDGDLKYLLQEDGSLNEDFTRKWIETQLEDAKSNKGKSKRNRLINKIINNIDIVEKDVNYDLKQTIHRNREMSKEIDEEYDESDVGHRQTEEMMEGAEEGFDSLPDEPEPEEESEEQRRLDEYEDW